MELGLGWSVNCDKDFVGKEKTCSLKKNGQERKLMGFIVGNPDAEAKKNDKVKLKGEEIGKVTTYTFGFTVEKNVGYVLVDSRAKEGQEVTIDTNYGEVEVVLHERMFYDPKGERLNA